MGRSRVFEAVTVSKRFIVSAVCIFAAVMSGAGQDGLSGANSKESRIIDVPRENIELLEPIPLVAGLPFLPYATGLKEPSDVVLGYRPEVADPTAIYDNFSTTSYSGVVNSNGGQSGGVTRLVADDLTLIGTPPYNLGSFLWVVCSTNTGTVTVRSLIRFYADNGGVPGNLIAGYNFPAFIPLTNSICQPIQVRLTPELQVAISTNKIWAATSFDRAEGASATEAQMNNIGGGFFNPPEAGSSADLFFRSTNAGDFFSNNPPGAVTTIAGNPVDNFGWDIRRRVKLNAITRLDANPRSPSATARWSVSLNVSDPADGTQLTGLTPSHFTLARTGSVTGTINSVVQNGTGNNSWTVTATLGAGTGTVGLNLTDNQTNLNTGIANAFPVVGEIYNVVGGATPTPTLTPTPTPNPNPTPTPTLTPTPNPSPTPTPTPTPMVTPTPTPTPSGSSLVVNKTVDTNDGSCTVADCSLREAVAASNAAAGADTITFDPAVFGTPQTITLANGNIVFTNSVNSNVTITGPGANLLTINGNNQSKVFTVTETPVVNISGMTLTGGNGVGNSPGNTFGGAVYNQGVLTLTNMVISGNSAGSDGGGVYSSTSDSLTLIGCTITNNTAASQSGGVHNHTGGTATITDSIISNNVANGPLASGVGGGGIYSEDGSTLTLTNSTISGNRATSSGGGLLADSITLTISNSTISGNTTTGGVGGGIAMDVDTAATITASTISGNTAAISGGGLNIEPDANTLIMVTNSTISGNSAPNGGGIFRDAGASLTVTLTHTTIASNMATGAGGGISGTMNLGNSLVANNTAPTGPDHGGTLNSNGFNLVENTAGTTITGTTASNVTGQDPDLGPLQNNGGRTFTHALLPGSPAIDKGASGSLTVDQRQVIRPIDNVSVANVAGGNGSDIGAFEAGYTISGRTFTPSGQAIRNATVSLFNAQSVRVMTATTSSFGIYSFSNIVPGEYTVTVSNKRYRFAPIVRQVNADLTNLDIFGLE